MDDVDHYAAASTRAALNSPTRKPVAP